MLPFSFYMLISVTNNIDFKVKFFQLAFFALALDQLSFLDTKY